MTSTIKRRPRGYRTGISSEVFEFVMKLLRDTLGTTGRYLDLMRSNAPLRIQGPGYFGFRGSRRSLFGFRPLRPRQFYRDFTGISPAQGYRPEGYGYDSDESDQGYRARAKQSNRHVHDWEWNKATKVRAATGLPTNFGSIVPFRNTYNASRLI